jgi:transcriptional regulator with XRE-family HTH domain
MERKPKRDIYTQIFKYIEKSGMSLNEFAARVGMTGQMLSNVHLGKTDLSMNSITKIGKEMGKKLIFIDE